MSSTTLNHTTEALAHVATQYRESARFIATISALAARVQELEDVLISLKDISDIDLAQGVQLDVIGALVGVGRVLPASASLTPAESILDDVTYRCVLRAKIVRNHSKGNGEDILKGLCYLFNVSYSTLDDNLDMSFSIGVGKMLSTVEKAILNLIDILPRPSGVLINYRVMFNSLAFFGFTDTRHAMGFGEEGVAGVGGTFAEEF